MQERTVRQGRFTVSRNNLVRTAAGCVALSLGLSASVVASPTPKHTAGSEASPAPKARRLWFQVGKASWYGRSFQGRKTADGESYDMNALTCAHRTLPLGSWIRVTNLRNKRSAFVRVNDRGPGPLDRVIDLSYAAARRIGIGGVARVKIEPVTENDPQLAEALVSQLPLHSDPAIISR